MSHVFTRSTQALFVGALLLLAGCNSIPMSARRPESASPIQLAAYQNAADEPAKQDAKGKNGDNGNGDKEKADNGPERPSKTLMSWNFGGKNGDDEDKNGDDEDKEEPLAADRPDFVEASSNVGRGRVQLEVGYTYIKDRSGGATTERHSYPEAVLRIGMFADWFELRIGQNVGIETQGSALERVRGDGAEDLYLGVGLGLTEQKGIFPESRIVLQMRVPTGSDAFTAERVLPGFNYLYGWEIIPDKLSLGASSQANRAVDDVGHFYTTWAQAVTMAFWFTDKLGSYLETFGIFPAGAVDSETGPQYYFDGGFVYRVTNNFQLDIRAGVGLNRHADDFFCGSGFAVRY